MFTKNDIEREKLNQNTPFFKNVLAPNNEEQHLLFALKSLGKLPEGFDGNLFLPLLEHQNPKIRCLAIKNLGKLKDEKYLTRLIAFAEIEKNTTTRREAVSAIGRLKAESTITVLSTFTKDADPKIILQALRGLLYFKEHPDVKETITSLAAHPNEIIREQIERDTRHSVQPKAEKTQNHRDSPDQLKNLMVCADVQDVMKVIPDESIHLTFTSPPYYNARDYTIFQSYNAYLDFLSDVFRETHRITKEGRFFVLNTSPVIVPRISRAHSSKRYAIPYDIHPRLTEMGWEFIDDIVWMKPEYAAKNRNGGFFQHRKPLGYKANSITESVMVYRKKDRQSSLIGTSVNMMMKLLTPVKYLVSMKKQMFGRSTLQLTKFILLFFLQNWLHVSSNSIHLKVTLYLIHLGAVVQSDTLPLHTREIIFSVRKK